MRSPRVDRSVLVQRRSKAAAGAALLDRLVPGWWRRIRLRKLDIADGCNCVTGQLFGDFEKGLNRLDLSHDEARAYGLERATTDLYGYYGLTNAWKNEVRARRYGHKVGRKA